MNEWGWPQYFVAILQATDLFSPPILRAIGMNGKSSEEWASWYLCRLIRILGTIYVLHAGGFW